MRGPTNLREVRLYFPNQWRKYIGDLVPEKDKRFNWFLCSQKYQDPKSGLYVAEIAKGAKFYDEITGETLVTVRDKEVKVIIVDEPENNISLQDAKVAISKYNYQGIAYLHTCDLKDADKFFVCREAIFGFVDGILKVEKTANGCAIIDYAKKNNECLRGHIPNFPTPKEIDEALAEYPRSIVCKALYQDMIAFLKTNV